ncbi:lactate/malate family dehydrogenase [Mesomycoplasma conjunctivae]|uniref:lactate/malate family dehydrogenase n=1 Tax=Mesomycoplasma conjunctivae TaxID=45361 RepID=UPI003DA269B2
MKNIAIINTTLNNMSVVNNALIKDLDANFFIINSNIEAAQAHVKDLEDVIDFNNKSQIEVADFRVLQKCDIILIDVHSSWKPGMSDVDVMVQNSELIYQIAWQTRLNNFNGLALILAPNNSIMARVFADVSGLSTTKVIGLGAILENLRINKQFGRVIENFKNNALVSGDSENSFVAVQDLLFKYVNISSKDLDIENTVLQANSQTNRILSIKNHNNWGMGFWAFQVLDAIVNNKKTTFILNVNKSDESMISDVFISLPTTIDGEGISDIYWPKFSSKEENLVYAFVNEQRNFYKIINHYFASKNK